MMNRKLILLFLLFGLLALPGCLFTINAPLATPDGTVALFLGEDGSYSLFPEAGVLHLLREEVWTRVPTATIGESGGLLDASPDGAEALYLEVESTDVFSPFTSTLHRVALQTESQPVAIWETTNVIARATWTAEDRILLLLFGEDDLATLHALNLETGTIEPLAKGLLSYAYLEEAGEILLLEAETDEGIPMGVIVRWDPKTNSRTRRASFVLSEGTMEAFTALPHRFFWAVAPDGAWLALSLYDGTVLAPAMEADIPGLYLVDLAAGETIRVSAQALMPAFSPDGQGLLFVESVDNDRGDLMYRSLTSDKSIPVPGGQGVSAAFWLSPTRIAMVFETDGEPHRLVELDLETEESRVLVDRPSSHDD